MGFCKVLATMRALLMETVSFGRLQLIQSAIYKLSPMIFLKSQFYENLICYYSRFFFMLSMQLALKTPEQGPRQAIQHVEMKTFPTMDFFCSSSSIRYSAHLTFSFLSPSVRCSALISRFPVRMISLSSCSFCYRLSLNIFSSSFTLLMMPLSWSRFFWRAAFDIASY